MKTLSSTLVDVHNTGNIDRWGPANDGTGRDPGRGGTGQSAWPPVPPSSVPITCLHPQQNELKPQKLISLTSLIPLTL